jgi:peroxiredoxin
MIAPLATGATMPPVHAKDLDGNEVDITASVAGRWAVVQFYRGHW